MDLCLVVRDPTGQFRAATHDEILDAADRIRSDLSIDEPGNWPHREWYVSQLKRCISENDFWLFQAGWLFEAKTAVEERDQMVKLITKDWFEGISGLRRANPPAIKRLVERNGLNVRDVGQFTIEVQYRPVKQASEMELRYADLVRIRMPEAAIDICDLVHVLTRGTYQGGVTTTQRVCRVTVTSGMIEESRALLILPGIES